MTGLTCICRWHNDQLNSAHQTFIGQKLSEPAKIPFANPAPEFLALLFCRTANPLKVFNGNPLALHSGNRNNLFTDGVIDNGSRSPLLSRKPFQNTLGVLRAFGLMRTPYFLSFFPIVCKFFKVKFFFVAEGGYFNQAHVYADKFFGIFDRLCRYLYGLKQVKLPFTVSQVSLTLDVGKVIRPAADKGNFEPASNRPDGNHVIRLIVQDAAIITDSAKGFEAALDLFIQLISIRNHTDAANDDLTAQISSASGGMVRSTVKFKLLKSFFLPGDIRNQVTGQVRSFNGLKQQGRLLIIRKEFYFQGQFHGTKILNNLVPKNYLKQIAGRIPPTHAYQRWMGFLLQFYERLLV
jgi:hypothetical protein